LALGFAWGRFGCLFLLRVHVGGKRFRTPGSFLKAVAKSQDGIHGTDHAGTADDRERRCRALAPRIDQVCTDARGGGDTADPRKHCSRSRTVSEGLRARVAGLDRRLPSAPIQALRSFHGVLIETRLYVGVFGGLFVKLVHQFGDLLAEPLELGRR
jgi:hypothetical protein